MCEVVLEEGFEIGDDDHSLSIEALRQARLVGAGSNPLTLDFSATLVRPEPSV
jgi:hypothetical protein